jgi:hypothetical protein
VTPPSSAPSWLPTLLAVPLVGFILYRRLRRSFGRQAVAPVRMVLRIALLSGIGCFLVVTSPPAAASYGAAGAGLVIGIALALVGLAHTKFEITPEAKFYVPNRWLGLVVTALFLGRLVARLLTMSERAAQMTTGADPFAGLQRSPLTLALYLLLAGYYVTYYSGLLWKTRASGAVGLH